MSELGEDTRAITVFCDSQSAIHLAKNQVIISRTKHIEVRYHFIREVLEKDEILLQKIGTAENTADMLTKVLHAEKFRKCLNILQVQ